MLRVVNISGEPIPATINLAGFSRSKPSVTGRKLSGPADDENTAEQPDELVPVVNSWTFTMFSVWSGSKFSFFDGDGHQWSKTSVFNIIPAFYANEDFLHPKPIWPREWAWPVCVSFTPRIQALTDGGGE